MFETDLMKIHKRDPLALKEQISGMSTNRLFSELDDTLQLDICKVENSDWLKNPDKAVYNAIIGELKKRIYALEDVDANYEEEDENENLDQQLFDAIYKGAPLPEGMTHKQSIGKALAAAVPIEDLEELIEVPSEETWQKWIRRGEALRKEREKENKE